jgi:hypothetical protein
VDAPGSARPTRRQPLVLVAVLLSFGLLAVALYLPTGPLANSALPSGGYGDPAQMTWFLAWMPYAVGHLLNAFHTGYLDYPNGVDLASNTSVPLLGLLGAPVTLALGPVASFNLLLRLGLFCSAASMFFVLRTACATVAAPALGGLVYGFGPYLLSQAQADAHLNLAFGPLPPVIMWCVVELFVLQQRRVVPLGLLLGAATGAQCLIDPEVLGTVVIVLCVVGLLALCRRRRWPVGDALYAAKGLGLGALVFLLFSGDFFFALFFGSGHLIGSVQAPNAIQPFAADLLSPLVPTSHELLAPALLTHAADGYVGGNLTENGGYLGLPLICAAVVSAVVLRRDRVVRFAVGTAVVAFVCSLGSRLTVNGHRVLGVMPESLFVHLPLLSSTIPARYGLVVICGIAALSALGLDHALLALRARPRRGRGPISAVLLSAAVVVVASLFPRVPFASESFAWPSSLKTTLAHIPSGSVVLTYPYPVAPWSSPMLWQAELEMRFRLVGGYATVEAPSGNGQYWPLLSYPNYIQEFFVTSENPDLLYYPSPNTRSGPTGRAALCETLTLDAVNAVVLWPTGADPVAVENLLTGALGTPSELVDGIAVWLNAARRCH